MTPGTATRFLINDLRRNAKAGRGARSQPRSRKTWKGCDCDFSDHRDRRIFSSPVSDGGCACAGSPAAYSRRGASTRTGPCVSLRWRPAASAIPPPRIIEEKLGDKLGQRLYGRHQPGAGGIAAARTVIDLSARRAIRWRC